MNRISELTWSIKDETTVTVSLNLDGTGLSNVKSAHKTLNHLIETFARYGRFDIQLSVESDGIEHHLFEHAGITLGLAIESALGAKMDLVNFSKATIPMDEAVAEVVVDLNHVSGGFVWAPDLRTLNPSIHHDGTELFCYLHFLEKLAVSAKINMHVLNLYAKDIHHAIEVLYKAVATAIYDASRIDSNPIKRLGRSISNSKHN